ncbi:MAG: DNA repair protein RecO [Desulfobulbus propionicus]|nr:MAG: DNA repair protein RecO [Desulfobulbus propionicus]
MNQAVSHGLVLRVADHGESDKLATLFSPDLGRVSAIAKGAKRSKRRFVNKLEPFSLLEFTYKASRNSTLLLLNEAELEAAHLRLRQHYPAFLAASYLTELLLKYTRDADPEPLLFALSLWALQVLERGVPPLTILVLYHLRLLALVGYAPQIIACARCGQTVSKGGVFHMPSGRVDLLCEACSKSRPGPGCAFLPGSLRFLADGLTLPLDRLDRLRLQDVETTTVLRALHRASQHLLQQDIHSWRALEELFPARPTGSTQGGTRCLSGR